MPCCGLWPCWRQKAPSATATTSTAANAYCTGPFPDATAPAATPARPVYTENYKRLVLTLLVVAYTLHFLDRTIIATIGQAIKVDLAITDTQLGLLGGPAFAVVYSTLAIPIAWLADRMSRVTIVGVSLAVWSGFTALCGSAASFAQLAAYRFGVGVGEAQRAPGAEVAEAAPAKSAETIGG